MPSGETERPMASHPIAYGEDHVQVVEVHQPLNLAAAFGLN